MILSGPARPPQLSNLDWFLNCFYMDFVITYICLAGLALSNCHDHRSQLGPWTDLVLTF